jgi:hypothetical protein
MSDEPLSPIAEEIEAIDRIARTHDGRMLHRYLRRVLEGLGPADVGALPFFHGRRTLARDLMGHMAQGIEGDSGRIEHGNEPILNRSGSGPTGGTHVGSLASRLRQLRFPPDPNVAALLREHGADET